MQYPHYVINGLLLFWVVIAMSFVTLRSPLIGERVWFLFAHYWWVLLPLIGIPVAWQAWVSYWELQFGKRIYDDMIFLRIRLPQDIEQTPKGMQQAYYNLHGMTRSYIRWGDRVFFRERVTWMSLELVAIGNTFAFIVGVERRRQTFIEAQLYSQYPGIEIEEIADYTQSIPDDAPNDQWQTWGVHYVLQNEDYWMIRTFDNFWKLEQETEATRKNDPIAHLAETASSLKPGEQIWIQMVVSPMLPGATGIGDWMRKGQAMRKNFDKGQPPKPPGAGEQVIGGVGDFLALLVGRELPPAPKEEGPQKFYVSTMEKTAVDVLGIKFEHPQYQVNLRAMYWAPKNIFDRNRQNSVNGFIRAYDDWTGNWFRMERRTRIRNRHFPHLFGEWRLQRKRKALLWYFRTRFLDTSFAFILNTLELASLYHFPGREVAAPSVKRLPFRRVQPPSDLPTI